MTETTTVTEVTYCSALTKKGLPCKNRPQVGGTLCGPHGKLDSIQTRFISTAIGKSHNRHAKIEAKIADVRDYLDVDEMADDVWGRVSLMPPPIDQQPEIVCVSGSRNNDHAQRTWERLHGYFLQFNPKPFVLVGDAKGTDRIAADFLEKHGYTYEVVAAKWENERGDFDKSAGMKRNELMLRRSGHLIAFSHEGYGDGDSGFQAPDKGTTQAIDTAQKTKKRVTIVNLSKWDAEESQLESEAVFEMTDEIQHAKLRQLDKADAYKYRPSLISLNNSSWVYIGRGKSGTAMIHPGMLAVPRRMEDPEFKRWIWQRMVKRDPHLLRELARITDTTAIICDCYVSSMHEDGSPDHYCHGHIIIAANNFLASKDGEQYRMTSQEIRDYDAVHHPALLATMSHSDGSRIVARYSQMIQPVERKPVPREMNGSQKLSKAKPLVKNSRVIYINGDLELPCIITHIEYGDRWIDDAYTGRRRLEITNCLLVNERIKANFVYSDSNAEMIRRGHRNSDTGMPSEAGLIPTIAPYIRKVKAVKEVTLTELTTNCRIKSGMPIRILDRATGAVMDVGIAKTVQSAMWYVDIPKAPAIKDAWIVEYHSLLTDKPNVWKGDEGTRIEAR